MMGEWRGHGEKGRDLGEEAEGGQFKSDHGRLNTKPRKLNGLDRKADNGAIARSRAQYSPTGRGDIYAN